MPYDRSQKTLGRTAVLVHTAEKEITAISSETVYLIAPHLIDDIACEDTLAGASNPREVIYPGFRLHSPLAERFSLKEPFACPFVTLVVI